MKKLLLLTCLAVLFVVDLQAQVVFNYAVTNPTCSGACNGTCNVLPSGNYRYRWSNGDSTQMVTGLCFGNYSVSVFDSAFNLLDTNLVGVSAGPTLDVSVTQTSVTCGQNNGSIIITASSGTPAFTFFWSNGATGVSLTNLSPGTYTYTVTDANGCSASGSVNIGPGTLPPVITDTLITPSACGACNGHVYTVITNGTAPFGYLWNGSDTRTNPTLCAGVNNLTVTDANNCTGTAQFIVNSNSGLTATLHNSHVDCVSQVDTATLTVTGGSHLLNFYWGDGSAPDSGVTSPHSHTYAGYAVYFVGVTDSLGCSYFTTDTVTNNQLQIGLVQATTATCTGFSNGSITVSAVGGTAPYHYNWNTGDSTATANNIPPGNYAVVAADNLGCSAIFSYFLAAANFEPHFYTYANFISHNCDVGSDTLIAVASGGTPPYSYLWSPTSQATDTITNLSNGQYLFRVIDSLGCEAHGSYLVANTCQWAITGTTFSDANGNCVLDSGDAPIQVLVVATNSNGISYYGSSSYGNYLITVPDSGTYQLTAYFYGYCDQVTLCGTGQQTVTLTGTNPISANNSFGVTANGGFDLMIHPGWLQANPGFIKKYWILPYNQSLNPFTGTATVVFTYDSNLIYQYSDTPLPVVNLAAHTLTWQVNNLPTPSLTFANELVSYFMVPATLSPNYLLQSKFTITPTQGDCDSANNTIVSGDPCGGSRDPNEKDVSPAGALTENDTVLTYTIHFQNTGTAATNFVIVTDTLSPDLDPASVVTIASSAKYTFAISGTGVLTWTFNPLFLPDSLSDVNGSKGFLRFTVKRKGNLQPGVSISNKASIYFDYNAAVVTNTVADTIAQPTYIFEVRNNPAVEVKAFPNPFNDVTNIVVTGLTEKFAFELYDVTGRQQQSIPAINNNLFTIHRNGLAGGVYLYRIIVTGNQVGFGKLVVE